MELLKLSLVLRRPLLSTDYEMNVKFEGMIIHENQR